MRVVLQQKRNRIRLVYALAAELGLLFICEGCIGHTQLTGVQISSTVNHSMHPLVARMSVQVSVTASVAVEFGTDFGLEYMTAPKVIKGGGGSVDILVAGMLPATTYYMRAVVTTENGVVRGPDHVFTTGRPPAAAIPLTVVSRFGEPETGVELLDMTSRNGVFQAAVVDLDGKLIWYYAYDSALGYPNPIRLLQDGNMLMVIGSQLMREVSLEGEILREITPDEVNAKLAAAGSTIRITGFHHEVLPTFDKHIVVLCEQRKNVQLFGENVERQIRGDVLVDMDDKFDLGWTWSAFDYLDINYHPMDVEDWTHANALLHSPIDGSLIVSMRNQHWIVKIDYANGNGSGDVLWRLGYGGDVALLNGGDFDWFYGQHFPTFAEPVLGRRIRLSVFDNRAINQDGSTCSSLGACYSRALILEVDEDAKTANIVWDNPLDLYSYWGGSIQKLINHVEYTLSSPFSGLGSRITEVDYDTKSPVWQMDVLNQWVYRGYRIPSLYPGVQW